MEGNSYTQLETYALIEYGAKKDEKPLEDAAMILNHKHAVDLLFKEKKILDKRQLIECNAILTDNTLTPDSRHFLPVEPRNRVRSFTPDGLFIGGSSYIPPQEESRGLKPLQNP